MMAITHGHLLACPCGGGKPDITQSYGVRGAPYFWVSCAVCGLAEGSEFEPKAVAGWNDGVAEMMAERVA